jgi:hypothetical protein
LAALPAMCSLNRWASRGNFSHRRRKINGEDFPEKLFLAGVPGGKPILLHHLPSVAGLSAVACLSFVPFVIFCSKKSTIGAGFHRGRPVLGPPVPSFGLPPAPPENPRRPMNTGFAAVFLSRNAPQECDTKVTTNPWTKVRWLPILSTIQGAFFSPRVSTKQP